MHELLSKDSELCNHLPYTLEATMENIKIMMKQHDRLFIKPCYSNIGKGIMHMNKTETGEWVLHVRNERQTWIQINFLHELPEVLVNAITSRPYIVQERITLAKYKGRNFDTRVIVQKNESGEWAITGKVGKLAQMGNVITNVGLGGDFADIMTFLDLNPQFSSNIICEEIDKLSLKIAKYLENYCYHIADLGMDLGVAQNGMIYFIECNFRSQYSGMEKNTDLLAICENVYENPIRYRSFLLRQMIT
ncbi:YheC/YheD family protein [Bacillus sp. RD4P76]|uniref:YheC/YheD family protein n=2 Tax=Bacillus suaedaesalsae TaxID=2810349 RepID=A0ABS2DIA4_9BACI|nr:YheC/YheD family protein [Bacillus suaedaesalsae]